MTLSKYEHVSFNHDVLCRAHLLEKESKTKLNRTYSGFLQNYQISTLLTRNRIKTFTSLGNLHFSIDLTSIFVDCGKKSIKAHEKHANTSQRGPSPPDSCWANMAKLQNSTVRTHLKAVTQLHVKQRITVFLAP